MVLVWLHQQNALGELDKSNKGKSKGKGKPESGTAGSVVAAEEVQPLTSAT